AVTDAIGEYSINEYRFIKKYCNFFKLKNVDSTQEKIYKINDMKNNIAYSYAHKDDTDNILYSNINNKIYYSYTNIDFIRTLSISSICKTFTFIHKKERFL
ncbi:hypothetical protein SLOPH_499, partial [Spraguea lophii 42_110]